MLLRHLARFVLLTSCAPGAPAERTRDAAARHELPRAAHGALRASADGGTSSPVRVVSGLPVPPGPADQPRPSAAGPGLRVLSWAGFRAAASYTFDDGQPSHLEHWPALKATRVPVTFYITTGYRKLQPGFDATWRDVVASGSELGNHTVHHCSFSGARCGVDGAHMLSPRSRELDDASDYIVRTAGQRAVWTAATPFGDDAWSSETRSRFLLTRGTIPGMGGDGMIAPRDGNDSQNLPTRNAEAGEQTAALRAELDRARTAGKWVILLFHSIAPTRFPWFATVDIASIVGSIEYGQQRGDLWLDSVVHVGAYWLAEALLSRAEPEHLNGQLLWTWQLPAHYPRGRFVRVRVEGGSLLQQGRALPWDAHGYYEVALDAGELRWTP